MREQAHDEDRALRNRLPTGMTNPADLPAHVSPAVAVEAGDSTEVDLTMRKAQLVSLMRTSLSTTRFIALPTDVVADSSAAGAAAW